MCDFGWIPVKCRKNHYTCLFIALILNVYLRRAPIAQSVTCLAADTCLTADPGVTSLIPARSHTFVDIDHEIMSMAILLPLLIQEGCCQLQMKVFARNTG